MQDKPDDMSLIKKYLDGTLTTAESRQLNQWFADHPDVAASVLRKIDSGTMADDLHTWHRLVRSDQQDWKGLLIRKIGRRRIRRTQRRIWRWTGIAAGTVLCSGLLLWQKQRSENATRALVETHPENMPAGTAKATLQWSDGKTLDLRPDSAGIMMGDALRYSNGDPLVENMPEDPSFSIVVPSGGRYHVALADGTKVWLNSNTTLFCPSGFGRHTRHITIEGEAFFQVARQIDPHTARPVPFTVYCKEHSVIVTGTQFNLKAYAGEPTETTLLEGSVWLIEQDRQDSLRLVAGEQGVRLGHTFQRKEVDPAVATAWKEGKFIFRDTPLKEAMRLISRWYNVDIYYESTIPETHFYGEISMNKSLNEVLHILRAGGVAFSLVRQQESVQLQVRADDT